MAIEFGNLHFFRNPSVAPTVGGGLRGSQDANYPRSPPPLGAFGQKLVAKGVALGRRWAPKAPNAP